MAESACAKVIRCLGGCVRFMITGGELEEYSVHVILNLATGDFLSAEQANRIWPLYEEFDATPLVNSERVEYEAKMTKKLKRIVWSGSQ